MSSLPELYHLPSSMEPLLPSDDSGRLESLAFELAFKAVKLSSSVNPTTAKAIADFIRPVNSYYSNLIEGHDTHPIDIDKALKSYFSNDKKKRDLQLEAKAHIALHKSLTDEFTSPEAETANPYSSEFIRAIHKQFYEHLPESFQKITSEEGEEKRILPGELRLGEVKVSRHIAPAAAELKHFMHHFEKKYSSPNSKTSRIIAIAASHHRLAWIHPFLDGNGRVVRLLADVCFMSENLSANGLWSISRGLARNNDEYYSRLANADMQRHGPHDGRGNLSNKMLVEFCEFFLQTAIDQVSFMINVLDLDHMLEKISAFSDLMALRGKLKPEAKYILCDVFAKGKLSKPDAMRITNTSDKTLKALTDRLIEMELLTSKKEGITMHYYPNYPIRLSPILFPGIYPNNKDAEMMMEIMK
jgi:Fic family protein